MFGSLYISQFIKSSRLWQVILQAEPGYRLRPEDLERLYVRSRDKAMVPLSAVVTSRYVTGPDLMTRFNNFPAVKVTATTAPGYSSGQAIAALQRVGAQALPGDFGLAWSGEAFEEQKAGSASAAVFAFGLLMVFLILAAQYEKWSLPFGVLLAVPFALFGAALAVMLRGLSNDIYFQIGLTMLVALAAKNAILIFEFAVLNRTEGASFYDAAMTAARERLRPIVMTSVAFILGCVPLAIATGASANSRISIGTGVIGGMLAATVIAVFWIPMFYYVIETLAERFGGRRKTRTPLPEEIAGPQQPAAGAGAGHMPRARPPGE
jgi:multidrug efflux pump